MHQARQITTEFIVEAIGLLLDPHPEGSCGGAGLWWTSGPWPHAVVVEYTAQFLEVECLVVETFPSEDKET